MNAPSSGSLDEASGREEQDDWGESHFGPLRLLHVLGEFDVALVQSNDAITLHPIQAVTAKSHGAHAIQKEASEIGVGDIVFCEVQPSKQYFAHIVLRIEHCYRRREQTEYWIGNIQDHENGWCYREHIFGILVEVQVWWEGQYHNRPHPKNFFPEVQALAKGERNRWNSQAAQLCEPSWGPSSSGQHVG